MPKLGRKFKQHLRPGPEKRTVTKLPSTVLQTWWVIEKCLPGNLRGGIVGVLKRPVDLTDRQSYRQTAVLVLTNTAKSEAGIALGWTPQNVPFPAALQLRAIDWDYKVAPDMELE